MEVNFEKMIETTTKFNELKKELDRNYYTKPTYVCDTDYKIIALKSAMDKLLILMDELVRS